MRTVNSKSRGSWTGAVGLGWSWVQSADPPGPPKEGSLRAPTTVAVLEWAEDLDLPLNYGKEANTVARSRPL